LDPPIPPWSTCVFPGKCLVVHGGDEPLPTVPGIYASVPRRWYDPKRHRAGFYLRTALDGSIDSAVGCPARFLYSFVGALDNHPVRRGLAMLGESDGMVLDSRRHPVPPAEARERFVRAIGDSLFVLCPRGGGTSSFRIFETMKAGRVPVILSDEWVEPSGPDWADCAVRIPEAEVASIPRQLGELRDRAPAMGAQARLAWERWFSADSAGNTVTGWLSELLQANETDGAYRLPMAMRSRYALRAARRWAGGMRGKAMRG
jgi:hypothetical protein